MRTEVSKLRDAQGFPFVAFLFNDGSHTTWPPVMAIELGQPGLVGVLMNPLSYTEDKECEAYKFIRGHMALVLSKWGRTKA